MEKMIGHFGHDTRRINHALKVFAFARIISYHEHLDSGTEEIVLYTALLHDIGIVEAERNTRSSAGNYQQIEGPPVAREILSDLGIPDPAIDRSVSSPATITPTQRSTASISRSSLRPISWSIFPKTGWIKRQRSLFTPVYLKLTPGKDYSEQCTSTDLHGIG